MNSELVGVTPLSQHRRPYHWLLGGPGTFWASGTVVASLLLTFVEGAVALGLVAVVRDLEGHGYDTGAGAHGARAWALLVGSVALRGVVQVLLFIGSSAVYLETLRLARRRLADWLIDEAQEDAEPAARTTSRLVEQVPKLALFAQSGVRLSGGIIQLVALVAILVWVAPVQGGIGVALMLLSLPAMVLVQRRVRRNAAALAPLQHRASRSLERIAHNLFLVRLLGTQEVERERLGLDLDLHIRAAQRASLTAALASGVPALVGAAALSLLVATGAVTSLTLDVAAPLLYFAARLIAAAGFVFGTVGVLVTCLPAVHEWLAEPPATPLAASTGSVVEEPQTEPNVPRKAPVTLCASRVSFRYRERSRDALRAVSFEVGAGETAGVVGPSGAGKTTLLKLAAGLLLPDSGTLLLDEEPAGVFQRRGGAIGYVGADPFLFAGTLRENLAYGVTPQPGEEQLWAALSASGMEAFVRQLPQGLNERLDEGGGGLSAGQRQRLALARALLQGPQLLILDEPTANLDEAAEQEVIRVLASLSGKVTLLVATHRASMLSICSKVVRLPAEDASPLAAPVLAQA